MSRPPFFPLALKCSLLSMLRQTCVLVARASARPANRLVPQMSPCTGHTRLAAPASSETMFDLLLPTLTLGGELLQVAMNLEKISCGRNSNLVAFKRWLDGRWAPFPLLSRLVPIVKKFALIICPVVAERQQKPRTPNIVDEFMKGTEVLW